jgi:hypothetical protein
VHGYMCVWVCGEWALPSCPEGAHRLADRGHRPAPRTLSLTQEAFLGLPPYHFPFLCRPELAPSRMTWDSSCSLSSVLPTEGRTNCFPHQYRPLSIGFPLDSSQMVWPTTADSLQCGCLLMPCSCFPHPPSFLCHSRRICQLPPLNVAVSRETDGKSLVSLKTEFMSRHTKESLLDRADLFKQKLDFVNAEVVLK